MDHETQALIDAYRRHDGVIDWYKVFDLPCTATQEQLEYAFAILSATFHPDGGSGDKEGAVRYALLQQGFKEIGDPALRKRYDAFCRAQHDHARLVTAIETARRKPTFWVMRLFRRADTRAKRTALLAFPFFAVVAAFRLMHDLDHYDWEPSLSFLLFSLASILCLLLAFTRLSGWVHNG